MMGAEKPMTDETPRYDPLGCTAVFAGRAGRLDVWHDPEDRNYLPWLLVWEGDYVWLRPDMTPQRGYRAPKARLARWHVTPHEWCLIHQRAAEYTNQKDPNQ